jgi:hypothetical protein
VDVRHAAAEALGKLVEPNDVAALARLAENYPEHSVRLALLRACRGGRPLSVASQ